MKKSQSLLIAIPMVVLLFAIGLAPVLFDKRQVELNPTSTPSIPNTTKGQAGGYKEGLITNVNNDEKNGNSQIGERTESSTIPMADSEVVIRDPASISELLEAVITGSYGASDFASDQLMTASSVCASYLNTSHDAPQALRSTALERLEEFCDIAPEAIEKTINEFEKTGYFEVMDRASIDMEFGDVNGAVETIRRYISQANRFGEIATAAAWLVELEYQSEPKPGIINTDEMPWEQAQLAASDAARVYYCQQIGGCDTNHFLTASFCAAAGCEEFVTDIEQAVFRSRSPRHSEIIQDLLAFFYSSGIR